IRPRACPASVTTTSPLRRPSSSVRNSAVSYDLPATTGKTVRLPLLIGLSNEYVDAGGTSPAWTRHGITTAATTIRAIPTIAKLASRIGGPPHTTDTNTDADAPACARSSEHDRLSTIWVYAAFQHP